MVPSVESVESSKGPLPRSAVSDGTLDSVVMVPGSDVDAVVAVLGASVVSHTSSLVGRTVGADVLSLLLFVQPQPTNIEAVRTRHITSIVYFFMGLPPILFASSVLFPLFLSFRQEKTGNEMKVTVKSSG